MSESQALPNLEETTELLRCLGDPTRVRLLVLLEQEELTVAELTRISGLTQSRVSTHVAKLKGAGLVRERRQARSTLLRLDEREVPADVRRVWGVVRAGLDDQVLADDRAGLRRVIDGRGSSWAESVAGRMERHYSPGRTWEAAARALVGLGRLGDVLDVASGDGALAEVVAPRARSITCVDVSTRVVSAAARRFARWPGARLVVGDMHALPFPDARFDHGLLVNSLSFSPDPDRVVAEVARVLRPEGTLTVAALARHEHRELAQRYDHVQMGFSPDELARTLERHGLRCSFCEVTSRERRAPRLRVVTAYAERRVPRRTS